MTPLRSPAAIADLYRPKDTVSVLRPILADLTMGNVAQAEASLKMLIIELELNLPDSWK